KESFLLVDGRYITQAKQEATAVTVLEYRDKFETISIVVAQKKITRIGLESTALSVDDFNKLKRKLVKVSLVAIADKLMDIRVLKEENEVNNIRQGAQIVSDVIGSLVASLPNNITEKALATEIDYQFKKSGADSSSFDTIVASGENSALPHAKPTLRKIKSGDALLIDCGATVNGYASDETCTFFIGNASKRQKQVYAIVKEAHDMAIEAIRPGVPCRDIDKIAREIIDSYGMGNLFSHSTGHGVGLDVHEQPKITAQSNNILESGMVVTIEPGIYIPNEFGVRIEDMILVKENSCEILTKISKGFTVIRK
ncbi:MAG: aminopeptidase P family protein, partial [Deltaproteobacteria bacterium]